MKAESESSIRHALLGLSNRVANVIDTGPLKESGSLDPLMERYIRDNVTHFEYNETGVVSVALKGEHILKPNWVRAVERVIENVTETEEHAAALKVLTVETPDDENASELLYLFLWRLAHSYLAYTDQAIRHGELDRFIVVILKHIRGEKMEYDATVGLVGIAVMCEPIEIEIGEAKYSLRAPTADDIQREYRLYELRRPDFKFPSAILHLSLLATKAHQMGEPIYRAINILRLFNIGSIKYLYIGMNTESFTDSFGNSVQAADERGGIEEKYVMQDADVGKLARFWPQMDEVIPEGGDDWSGNHINHISIAYQRYNDALFIGGINERRIANAVMGLESLILRRDDKEVLGYRLRTRMARLLGLLGENPYEVRKTITYAYTVRSAFVHGENIKDSDRKEIERRFGDLKRLLNLVLNYLRITIVMALRLQPNKEALITLVDDSFIDDDKRMELQNLIAPIITLI